MEGLVFKQKRNNYVPEAKPNAELEYAQYITGKTIEEIINADMLTRIRIMALLIEVKNYL